MQPPLAAILEESLEQFGEMTDGQDHFVDSSPFHLPERTSRIGISPIGINGLGKIFVYGARRVPFPPARITAFIGFALISWSQHWINVECCNTFGHLGLSMIPIWMLEWISRMPSGTVRVIWKPRVI